MSEESTANGAAATPAEAAGPVFTVEKLYLKDASLEVPGAPQIFNDGTQPELQMNLNQRVQRLNENAFEVVLGITLTCTVGDKTAYLVEVQQAGVFGVSGFDPQTTDAMLGIQCPSVLYPYARQIISELVQSGGFPPFHLQPLNFEGLYADGLRQRQQQAAAAGDGDAGNWPSETAGNA